MVLINSEHRPVWDCTTWFLFLGSSLSFSLLAFHCKKCATEVTRGIWLLRDDSRMVC